MVEKKKTVKRINIDVDKCNGCRACETICSASHTVPKFSTTNPARSRIRVIYEPLKDIFIPVYAGEYTDAECTGRTKYTIGGKKYEECAFCRASCSSRDIFKEPDSGLPLKCDMCEDESQKPEPLCVRWCLAEALTYEEREEEGEILGREELEISLESLANRYGFQRIVDILSRMSEGDRRTTTEARNKKGYGD